VKANGKEIKTVQDLKDLFAGLKPGEELAIDYERQGRQAAARIRLWGKSWRWV